MLDNWKNLFPKENRYFETENGILYCGDCLEVMKEFPKNSIDLVVADPPYGIHYVEWDVLPAMNKFFNLVNKIANKQCFSLFVFSGWSNVCQIITIGQSCFSLKDWIIWDRVKGRGTRKSLVSTREDILWFYKNNYHFNKDLAYSKIEKKTGGFGRKNKRKTRALSNVWTDISPIVPWGKERVNHPTQKPIELIERIVMVFAVSDSLILDPFLGSGTTAVACEKLNRRWVGIEINPDYCEIAKKRILEVISFNE